MAKIIKPIGDKIITKVIESSEVKQTESKLVLSKEAQPQIFARVLQVNTDVVKNIKTDDIIVFGEGLGSVIKIDGEEYRVLSPREIIGVIQEV